MFITFYTLTHYWILF